MIPKINWKKKYRVDSAIITVSKFDLRSLLGSDYYSLLILTTDENPLYSPLANSSAVRLRIRDGL